MEPFLLISSNSRAKLFVHFFTPTYPSNQRWVVKNQNVKKSGLLFRLNSTWNYRIDSIKWSCDQFNIRFHVIVSRLKIQSENKTKKSFIYWLIWTNWNCKNNKFLNTISPSKNMGQNGFLLHQCKSKIWRDTNSLKFIIQKSIFREKIFHLCPIQLRGPAENGTYA